MPNCKCGAPNLRYPASGCHGCRARYLRERRAAGFKDDKRRNHRTGRGDVTCRCPAYRKLGMPAHRQFGGSCTLIKWVRAFFDPSRRDCLDCHNLDGHECQVVNGTEQAWQCPALREYVTFNGIQLYGRAREARERCESSAHT